MTEEEVEMTAKTKKETEGGAAVADTPETKQPKERVKVTITCVDCGTTREINKGEEFQVKRCEACQLVHRKLLRKQYRKNRLRALRDRVALLEEAMHNAGIAVPA